MLAFQICKCTVTSINTYVTPCLGVYVMREVCVCVRMREGEAFFFLSPVSQWCWVNKINIPISIIRWKQVRVCVCVCVNTGEAFPQNIQIALVFLRNIQQTLSSWSLSLVFKILRDHPISGIQCFMQQRKKNIPQFRDKMKSHKLVDQRAKSIQQIDLFDKHNVLKKELPELNNSEISFKKKKKTTLWKFPRGAAG